MMSIFGESKKLGGLIAPDRIECAPGFIGSIAVKTERWQQLAVKLHCPLKVFHPQINVIQNSRLHWDWIFLISVASSGSKLDLGKRAVNSRQLAPVVPAKTALKLGSDSSTRFMLTSATACQKRIPASWRGSTTSALDVGSFAIASSRSAVSLASCSTATSP